MNRYKLVHVTRFSYDGPVSESYNELRLRPRHDENQSCLSFRVTTQPAAKAVGHQDFYGNWVHLFHILPEHRNLKVETEAVVLTHPQPVPVSTATMADLDARREAEDRVADKLELFVVAGGVGEVDEVVANFIIRLEFACFAGVVDEGAVGEGSL